MGWRRKSHEPALIKEGKAPWTLVLRACKSLCAREMEIAVEHLVELGEIEVGGGQERPIPEGGTWREPKWLAIP